MSAVTLDAQLREIVREVVREELQAALVAGPPRRNSPSTDDGYLSIARAATFADVAPGTLRRWIRSGRLPARRAGRVHRIARVELEDFLARNGRGADVAARAREISARRP